MGCGVETVQDLHIVIPDEQLLGQNPATVFRKGSRYAA